MKADNSRIAFDAALARKMLRVSVVGLMLALASIGIGVTVLANVPPSASFVPAALRITAAALHGFGLGFAVLFVSACRRTTPS